MIKILIIDDDEGFKKILQKRLSVFMNKAEFTTFSDLTSVRNHFKSNSQIAFDVVFIDEHLPDGRGKELIAEGIFKDHAVISMSSDVAPEIPGSAVLAGANYFVQKTQISQPLFQPLVKGIVERNVLSQNLAKITQEKIKMDTIKTLVSTLKHEINNPLGAVLGAAYLMKTSDAATPEQIKAAELVESSGTRITEVLNQLSDAFDIEATIKGNQEVFHVPGDSPWSSDNKE